MKGWKTKTGNTLWLVNDNIIYLPRKLYKGESFKEYGYSDECIPFDIREDLSNINKKLRECHECLSYLGNQIFWLPENPEGKSLSLGRAYGCLEVAADLDSYFPGETLDIFEEKINKMTLPRKSIFGRAGGRPNEGHSVIFYPSNREEAKMMKEQIDKAFRDGFGQNVSPYIGCARRNGCYNTLVRILGDPPDGPPGTWQEKELITHSENVGEVLTETSEKCRSLREYLKLK